MKNLFEYSILCKLVRQRGDIFSKRALDTSDNKNFHQNVQHLKEQGWEEVCDTQSRNPSGYYGIAFKRNKELVIVHRGTQFYEVGNVIADLMIAAGKADNPILAEAEKFTNECVRKVHNPYMRVTHIGFSLGGYIAGSLASLNIPSDKVRAYTFDAPGVVREHYRPDDQNLQSRVFNYFLRLNFFNTVNYHNGLRYQISTVERSQYGVDSCEFEIDNITKVLSFGSRYPNSSSVRALEMWVTEGQQSQQRSQGVLKLVFELLMTQESHAIEKFIDHFKHEQKGSLREIFHWPSAEITFLPSMGINYKRQNNLIYKDEYNRLVTSIVLIVIASKVDRQENQRTLLRIAQTILESMMPKSSHHTSSVYARFKPTNMQDQVSHGLSDSEESSCDFV